MRHPTMNECDSKQDSSIGPNDVLLGRGGATNNHNGNRQFRLLIAQHQHEYLQARKRDKVVIARGIVAMVKATGGRFLKRGNDDDISWIEVADKRAQEKASQALREGLDVRNQTTRPSKMIKAVRRSSESSSSQTSTSATTTKKTLVAGKTVTNKSPLGALNLGQQNTTNLHMPELKEESSEPVFLLYQPPPLSVTQLEHACEV